VRRSVRFPIVAAALLALSGLAGSPARALNFSVGDVVVQNLSSFGFENSASRLYFDGGTDNLIYQMMGFVGTAGGSGVVAVDGGGFRTLPGQGINVTTSSNTATATSGLRMRNRTANTLGLQRGAFTTQNTFTFTNDTSPADADSFTWDVTFTNQTAAVLDLVYYSYLDLEAGGTFANDVATGSVNGFTIADTDPSVAPVRWMTSQAADHFELQAWPSGLTLLNNMTAAADLGDPTGTLTGDFTGILQYNLSLAPGQSTTLSTAVPEPAMRVLLLLVGMALWSRRPDPADSR